MADASAAWQRSRGFIEAALARSPGFETIEDVERLIGECRYQFWPGDRSALITEIVPYPRCDVLVTHHAGGDLGELIAMRPMIEAFAVHAGCSKIMGEGRRGWERIFAPHGYRFAYTSCVKDLR